MNFEKTVRATLIAGAVLAALAGCQKQEGPAEKAGKEIDRTTEKVGQQIEKAGEKIQDATKGNGK